MTDISKEYASALFELAREISAEKEFLEALFLIQAALKEQPEYVSVLSSPNLSVREKKSEKRKDSLKIQTFRRKFPWLLTIVLTNRGL